MKSNCYVLLVHSRAVQNKIMTNPGKIQIEKIKPSKHFQQCYFQ